VPAGDDQQVGRRTFVFQLSDHEWAAMGMQSICLIFANRIPDTFKMIAKALPDRSSTLLDK